MQKIYNFYDYLFSRILLILSEKKNSVGLFYAEVENIKLHHTKKNIGYLNFLQKKKIPSDF